MKGNWAKSAAGRDATGAATDVDAGACALMGDDIATAIPKAAQIVAIFMPIPLLAGNDISRTNPDKCRTRKNPPVLPPAGHD
jgi:hypothetical protein